MNYNIEIQKINKILATDYDHEIPDKIRSKKFNKAFMSLMKRMFPEYTIIPSDIYCEAHGFIVAPNGKYVYYSTNDYRWGKWDNNILYRKAENEHDFHGGSNNFADLDCLKDCIENLVR